MYRNSRYCAVCLLCLLALIGCTRPPKQEIASAKAAVDTVMAEGAEKYAPDETRNLHQSLASALAEVSAQENRLLKNFAQARILLDRVVQDAAAIERALPEHKTRAKTKALEEFEAAKTAFGNVQRQAALFRKTQKGTDSAQDFLNTDLELLHESLAEAEHMISHEDFPGAIDRASDCRKRSESLSAQLLQSMPRASSR